MVTSPLVGTFHEAPAPGAEVFVSVRDVVEPGRQLAAVEAMRLFTPITADCRAEVVTVHATDGEIVEYAQPLVELAPVD